MNIKRGRYLQKVMLATPIAAGARYVTHLIVSCRHSSNDRGSDTRWAHAKRNPHDSPGRVAERERLNLTTANVYTELALTLNAWLAAEEKEDPWATPVELPFLVPLENIFRFTYLAHRWNF